VRSPPVSDTKMPILILVLPRARGRFLDGVR